MIRFVIWCDLDSSEDNVPDRPYRQKGLRTKAGGLRADGFFFALRSALLRRKNEPNSTTLRQPCQSTTYEDPEIITLRSR